MNDVIIPTWAEVNGCFALLFILVGLIIFGLIRDRVKENRRIKRMIEEKEYW